MGRVRADGVFVGREAELARLEERCAAACAGEPQVVLVTGEAGIGKTTIVRRLLAAHPEVLVLDAQADEAEHELPFGVIDQLARAAAAAGAPADLVEGLRLGEAPPASEPSAIGSRLLDLVSALEEQRPNAALAIVIDDLPWADLSSVQAFAFVMRRLRGDRVVALLTARTEGLAAVPGGIIALASGDRGARVDLVGLGDDDLAALAQDLGLDLPPPALQSLGEQTAGNPLYASALLVELDPAQLLAADAPLPAPRSFATLVLGRLAGCSAATEQVVVAAAVLGIHAPADEVFALATVADPLAAADEAVDAGFLAMEGIGSNRTLRFVHPLIRSAIYHDLAPGRRVELHASAATVVSESWSRLRHRAAAAIGPSPSLVAELQGFADEQLRLGQPGAVAAAAALTAAAALAPDNAAREDLLLQALEAHISARDLQAAMTLAGAAASFAPSARHSYLDGMLLALGGDLGGGAALLERALDQATSAGDAALGNDVLAHLALCQLMLGDFGASVEAAEQVPDLVGGLRGITPGARPTLAYALAALGRYDEAVAVAADPEAGDVHQDAERLLPLGIVALWRDDLDEAPQLIGEAAALALAQGSSVTHSLALAWLAQAELRNGAWDAALQHAELAGSICDDAEFAWIVGQVHGPAATVHAHRGSFDDAQRHLELAGITGGINGLLTENGAIHLAATRGDHDEAVRIAEALAASPLGPMAEPGYVDWRVVGAEALVAVGRVDEAEAMIAPFAARAEALAHRTGLLQVERVRAQVAVARDDTDAAAGHFDRAHAHAAECPSPFEVAKLDVVHGGVLRRAGRRRDAVTLLERSRDAFTALGALVQRELAERELASCGLTPARRSDDERLRLTPTEQTVTNLVLQGLRTKDVATELIVSPKTVEYHLSNIYRKLGVTNRAQLAAVLADRGG